MSMPSVRHRRGVPPGKNDLSPGVQLEVPLPLGSTPLRGGVGPGGGGVPVGGVNPGGPPRTYFHYKFFGGGSHTGGVGYPGMMRQTIFPD